MKRSARLTVIALFALGVAAAAWYLLSTRLSAPPAQGRTGAPASSGPTEPVVELARADMLRIEPGRLTRTLPVTGTLAASAQTLVRARVAGDVLDIPVREGMSVSAGQLLARIDPTDFELRVNERTAQLRSAQAQLDQARRTLENNARLLDKAFISQNAFDNAQSAVEVAAAARDGAEALLSQARKALADTRILAPMTGIVAQRFVQPGEKISPDGRIVSIVDLSRIELEAAVPASEIASVKIGQRAQIRIEGMAQPSSARVLRINPSTAAGTRSVTVYLGLDKVDERLRAGMFAQGSLTVDERDGLLLVPLSALRERGSQRHVYLIENGRIVERSVETGLIDESASAPGGFIGVAEIRSGLNAGDQIIRQNLGQLSPGARARITD
jgi:membrane fusion protein (multidrug efflux system)